MSIKENVTEEVDIGKLFKLIGDIFTKFFRFIEGLAIKLFKTVISFLLFIQLHFMKFIIAGIIGLCAGWYLDFNSQMKYRSSMIVEPNFNSGQQLYNNIEFYDELAKQEVFKTLASSLGITPEEAKTIKRLKIRSFTDENQRLEQFSNFIKNLDTISRGAISYDDYIENFSDITSRFHKIEMETIDPEVARKCQNAIVNSIENNQYFQLQKRTNDMNLRIEDSIIKVQLKNVDSLKSFYQNLKLIELKKDFGTTGTKIDLSSEKSQTDDLPEIKLLNNTKVLNKEILENNQKKADTRYIINVISDFPNRGAEINDFLKSKKLIIPLILIGLTFLSLVLISANRFLKNYKKETLNL